jgi:cytochrome c553
MKSFTLFIAISILFSCKSTKKETYSAKSDVTVTTKQLHPGKKLLESNCIPCHSATASIDGRIAPPMIAIKKHYIGQKTTKAVFVRSMIDWIENPSEETALMHGALKRYGIMPKLDFPKEMITQIAEYMFDYEVDEPEWFEAHFNVDKGNGKAMKECIEEKNDIKEFYTKRGLKYAMSTKKVLGKNLIGKIQKEGTLSALQFCNVKAFPLTDSLAVVHNATIKRVSDKPRNSKNKASTKENEYIAIFKADAKFNKESEPIVVETTEHVEFYYPIKTNGKCLQCHGKEGSEIKENILAEIHKLYPNDFARGYDINEVRGIWSIQFGK